MSKRAKWTLVEYGCSENPGVFDNGNGALMYVRESKQEPGIERVLVSSYCGRHRDYTYYRLAAERHNEERRFATLAEARAARRDAADDAEECNP